MLHSRPGGALGLLCPNWSKVPGLPRSSYLLTLWIERALVESVVAGLLNMEPANRSSSGSHEALLKPLDLRTGLKPYQA